MVVRLQNLSKAYEMRVVKFRELRLFLFAEMISPVSASTANVAAATAFDSTSHLPPSSTLLSAATIESILPRLQSIHSQLYSGVEVKLFVCAFSVYLL